MAPSGVVGRQLGDVFKPFPLPGWIVVVEDGGKTPAEVGNHAGSRNVERY
jgi:hypothetical protein